MGHKKVSWNRKPLSGLTLNQFKKRFETVYPEIDLESEFYGLFPEKRPKTKPKAGKGRQEAENE